MNYIKKVYVIIFMIALFGCSSLNTYDTSTSLNNRDNWQTTSNFYDSMLDARKPNIALLTMFFNRMPKGGDLHHHYTGTIYAETYLDWVGEKSWWIDKCTLKIVKEKKDGTCDLLTVEQLIANDVLYRKLLTLWSDKDYSNHNHNQPPPDTNFFNTFGYFGEVSDEFMDIGLNILKERAIKENVTYIETMLKRVGVKSSDYFSSNESAKYNKLLRNAKSQQEVDEILSILDSRFETEKGFTSSVNKFVSMVDDVHQGIDGDNFFMRYQTYAVRVLEPLQVFADLFSGYLAAEKSQLIVGVNIVAPENNTVALNDYTLHMRMYNYLARKFPNVNRALHAGELALGMVRPKDLTFHIQQARDIAQAQRIGHGVDLPFEQDFIDLLRNLKEKAAIEINLTSNEFILGIEGNKHPYLIYSSYDVPLVISTDDSGVSRNNLTNEYLLLATRYQPKYDRIKEYVYNSIEYSFLDQTKKSVLKKNIDVQFIVFESDMAGLYKSLNQ